MMKRNAMLKGTLSPAELVACAKYQIDEIHLDLSSIPYYNACSSCDGCLFFTSDGCYLDIALKEVSSCDETKSDA